MNMKRIIALLPLAFLIACSDKQNVTHDVNGASAVSSVNHNQDLPVYNVASDLAYVPYVMTDHLGQNYGLEIDILNKIAEKQGFRLKYVRTSWDDLFVNMAEKEIHIASNGMAIEDVEQEAATPTASYMTSFDCIAALKPEVLKTWQRHKIAVGQSGRLGEELQQTFGISKASLMPVETQYLGLTAILKQEAEVAAGDCTALRYYANGETLKSYSFTIQDMPNSQSNDSTKLVFAVRKDQTELLNKINAGLKAIEQSGELAEIKRKWGQQ